MWVELKRIIKPNGAIVLFGSEPFSSMLRVSNLKMYKYDWIWKKQKPSNFQLMNYQCGKIHELIHIFTMGATSYTRSNNSCPYYPQVTSGEIRKRGVKVYGENTRTTLRDDALFSKDVQFKDYTGRMPTSILDFSVDVLGKLHPTQKPVALLEYLIKTYTQEGETVLDFTMGSGSTGVACLNANRGFIGIELDEKYFNIARDRIKDTVDRIEKSKWEKLNDNV